MNDIVGTEAHKRATAAVKRGLGGKEDHKEQAEFLAFLALTAAANPSEPGHTCTPGLIGSAYGCAACGIGPEGARI